MRHPKAAVVVLSTAAVVSLTACTPGALGGTAAAAGSGTPTSVPQSVDGALPSSGTSNNDTVQAFPAAASCRYMIINASAGEYLPDPASSPGALNPAVTQDTIQTTICRSGYTTSIRPSVTITDREKQLSAAAYSYTGSFKTAELDHIVSLELGGASNDARNLYLEPNRSGATSTTNPKDSVEDALHTAVCAGKTSLSAAQHAIASNWTTALPALGLPQVRALNGTASGSSH